MMPTTTKYLWSNGNIIAEADESDTINVVYTYEPQQYGNLISTQIEGTTYYHHYDALGSTRQLTDVSGTVTDQMTYDAWGNIISRTGTEPISMLWIGEVGYYYDLETELFTIRDRSYTPITGRWTSRDHFYPELEAAYNYALNAPMSYFDPSGLRCNVCGSLIQTRVLIADADKPYVGRPHWQLANATKLILQGQMDTAMKGTGQALTMPALISSGPGTVLSKPDGTYLFAFFFFYVHFDVCVEPNSTCILKLDESGSLIKKIGPVITTTAHEGADEGEIASLSRGAANADPTFNARTDTKIAKRVNPAGACNYTFIYSDAPRLNARKGAFGYGMDNMTKQKFVMVSQEQLADGQIRIEEVYTLSHEVRITATKGLDATFSP